MVSPPLFNVIGLPNRFTVTTVCGWTVPSAAFNIQNVFPVESPIFQPARAQAGPRYF